MSMNHDRSAYGVTWTKRKGWYGKRGSYGSVKFVDRNRKCNTGMLEGFLEDTEKI